ncbi:hypothetical protein L3Q82_026904 [Scortum barcoo]|uniref:Uncharacterized protein n=1 Tax=Scortum barcoo TaxID=214431 RepID=A0ACB8WK17_9TELE|nr:hypothetical protein L3Q82_026904 [Scortum barcoo]
MIPVYWLANVSAALVQFSPGNLPTRLPLAPGNPAPHPPSVPILKEPMQALIDSGVEESYIYAQVAEQAGIPSKLLEKPWNALAVDGRILARVTHCTLPLTLVMSATHNPHVDCAQGKILNWSLLEMLLPTGEAPVKPNSPAEPVDLPGVPTIYHELKEMISSSTPRPCLIIRLTSAKFCKDSWKSLFVKKEKCEFRASQVSFHPAFILKWGQVYVDPEKVKAVTEWSTLTSIAPFLGFTNFYLQFIWNYSQEAAPLTALTSPSRPLVWSEEAK